MAQGCERFFLIDHGSPDQTVARAVKGGAEHIADRPASSTTEAERVAQTDALTAKLSEELPGPPIWWLHVDADEFPHGPNGMTIREYLGTLDRSYRVVGSTFYNHYPTAEPANIAGTHPIALQPMCERELFSYCRTRHYKHQLVRFDYDGPPVHMSGGFHKPAGLDSGCWDEPPGGLITHHFQFRDEAVTRRRHALVLPRRVSGQPLLQRDPFLDHVYAGAWSEVRLRRTRLGNRPVKLRDWRELLRPEDQELNLWYEPSRLDSHSDS